MEAGDVDGLRVDHPDGLSDPGGYMRRLRAAIGPDRWLLVEKILGVGEELPASWPVDGTSGYEALREICGVFVDPDGAGLLTQLAAEHTGRKENAHAAEHAARREVADTILAAEVRRIAALVPVADAAPSTDEEPGPAADRVREAVAELLCGFPVYRSYLPEGRAALDTAVVGGRSHTARISPTSVGVIAGTMLADPEGAAGHPVQQTSGMVMAKGVEDTAFYRWNRFVALNEVGGDPARFGVSPAEFHAAAPAAVAVWPRTMTTLSTHDTKRSEDVRARLAVLAEIPGEWAAAVRGAGPPRTRCRTARWSCWPGRTWSAPGRSRPSGWPAYLGKASKEAKLVTSHVDANAEVDEAIAAWPAQVLADPAPCAEIDEFVARIAGPGREQLAGPEAAADRRARRPRRLPGHRAVRVLAGRPGQPAPGRLGACAASCWPASTTAGCPTRASTPRTGRRSCWSPRGAAAAPVPARAVRRLPAVPAEGPAAEHAVAFPRSPPLVAVATRLPVGLAARGGWARHGPAAAGRGGDWTDVITGTPVEGSAPRLAQVLARYPVALLVRPA